MVEKYYNEVIGDKLYIGVNPYVFMWLSSRPRNHRK